MKSIRIRGGTVMISSVLKPKSTASIDVFFPFVLFVSFVVNIMNGRFL